MTLTLSSNEQEFVKALAHLTGLNTRTLQGWVANEEGTRSKPAGRNDYNFLNVGVTDSGPLSLVNDRSWKSPTGAAANTAAFLKGQKYGASPGIRQILKTVGGSVGDQIHAIQGSGWASGGESSLPQLVSQTRGLHNIGGSASAPATTKASMARVSTPTATKSVATTSAAPQGLSDLIDALQPAQQTQQVAPTSFNPGTSKYLAGGLTPGSVQAPAQTQQPDVASQLASLSAIQQPTTTTRTTTTNSQPTATNSQPTATAASAGGHVATQRAGANRASSFANSHVGHYAENQGSNQGSQLNSLEARVGMKGEPWCAIFATTAAVHGGAPTAARTASVSQIAQWAHAGTNGYQRGILPTSQARKGDLIMRGGEHVGFVDGRTANGGIIVIEGNANGSGGVAKRVYQPGAWTGIARPTYRR